MKIEFKEEAGTNREGKEKEKRRPGANVPVSRLHRLGKEEKQELENKIRMHIRQEEKNSFQRTHTGLDRLSHRNRRMIFLAIALLVVYILAILAPTGLDHNNVNASFAWWFTMVRRHIQDLGALLGGQHTEFMHMTTARYVMVALVGAVLALSGTVFQGALRNGLASPTTLGVQSGGVAGGTIYVMFFMPMTDAVITGQQALMEYQNMSVFQRYEESFFILIGSLVAVCFVVGVARLTGKGKISTITLVLTGMIFGAAASGITGLVRYWLLMYDTFGDRTYELRYMMMGSFSRIVDYHQLLVFGLPAALGIFVILMLRNRLNLIVFGEDEARAMGVPVDLTRNILVLITTALVALVISSCGMIGFIGFIIPHLTRRITGPDFRWLLPGAAMLGAIFLMIIYCIGATFEYADNVNVLTSFIGGILFLCMLLWYRRKSNADWA